jgi:hypothetical protein
MATLAPSAALATITAPSLAADTVIAVDAGAFASALGIPEFSTDENPAVHMANPAAPISVPGSPNVVAAPVQSLWQTASVGIRTIAPVDWTMRRANAVAFMTGITW